jgi:hypothetical protein
MLLCLGSWSHLGFVNNENVHAVTVLADVEEELELVDGWDRITI